MSGGSEIRRVVALRIAAAMLIAAACITASAAADADRGRPGFACGPNSRFDLVSVGTGAGQRLRGSNDRDKLIGKGGDDLLLGMQGDDCLDGGAGHDRLFGARNDDVLAGGTGPDLLVSSTLDDHLLGGTGGDRLYGEFQDDDLKGGSGDDLLQGSQGQDALAGDGGDDRLVGGTQRDLLVGGPGQDRIVSADNRPDEVRCGTSEDRVLFDHKDSLRGCESKLHSAYSVYSPYCRAEGAQGCVADVTARTRGRFRTGHGDRRRIRLAVERLRMPSNSSAKSVLVVADPLARRLLRKRRTVRATLSVALHRGDELGFVREQTTFGFRPTAGDR